MLARLTATVRFKAVLILGSAEKVGFGPSVLAASHFSSDKEKQAKEAENQAYETSSDAPRIREISHEATVEEKLNEEQIHPDWIGLERRLSHRKPRPKSEKFCLLFLYLVLNITHGYF